MACHSRNCGRRTIIITMPARRRGHSRLRFQCGLPRTSRKSYVTGTAMKSRDCQRTSAIRPEAKPHKSHDLSESESFALHHAKRKTEQAMKSAMWLIPAKV